MLPEVLIIGADHHNTLGVIESLALYNIKSNVIIIDHNAKYSYVIKSKYVVRSWHFRDNEAALQCMLSQFNPINGKIVVFATNDDIANFLDENAFLLNDKFILPISSYIGSLGKLMSKETMSEIATKVGLTIPKTDIVIDGKLEAKIEYPCITKAISSIAGSKSNIKICDNVNELKDFLSDSSHCHSIQIQKFIDKQYEFQFLGCSLNAGKEIIIPGRTHIERPNGIDNTFFLKYMKCEKELEELLEQVKSFIRITKYSGLFSVEFLKGKDGKCYFTEMNFRNDGNAYCVTDAGINLPYIWYAYNAGLDYKKEANKTISHESFIMPELYYTKRLFAGEVSLQEWIRNFKKTTCFTTYFKNDKVPFFYFLLVSLEHLRKSILRKLHHDSFNLLS